MDLEVAGSKEGEVYNLIATLKNQNSNESIYTLTIDSLNASEISGNIGLVSSFSGEEVFNTKPSAWFDNIEMEGSKVQVHPERSYGPVLFTQYTLSERKLKMTAQLPPIGDEDDYFATLEIFDSLEGKWIATSKEDLDPDSRTVLFSIPDWQSLKSVPYRVNYQYMNYDGSLVTSYFPGVVQKDPVEKQEFKVAAFTGNNDLGFPDNDLIENVRKHDPDLFFFSGDQIYERVGGYGVQRTPTNMAILDYLRKWYQFGWIYRDLIRSRPSIAIPDDHDVFHGNIFGASGKATPPGLRGTEAQDQGGYKMPPEFVNMVQRTQTSHFPAPYDPTPVLQDIGVYYTDMTYGGISFAILEDRKFKSAPTPLLPEGEIWNGWAQNPDFDAKTQSDHPDAVLLGDRQLEFLEDWAANWSEEVWMKSVLSQTIFANVATLPEHEVHDQNVPKLRILNKDEYPPNDKVVADMDSNGWPKSGRDAALRAIRKAFALHIAGDQHLGSTIQYGIDEYGDAGFAICVPSVSNIWPRRWYPPYPGENHEPGTPPYTGDYEDGFGNKMTVLAVSNPLYTGRKPSNLYDRATGYGIVTFRKESREIEMSNWPRDVDPTKPDSKPYEGWPITIHQHDNFKQIAFGYLPEIEVKGIKEPVFQIIDEDKSEIVYTIRLAENTFRPPVYTDGVYTVLVGISSHEMKKLENLTPTMKDRISISF
jgi:hypothetical protein